MGGDADLVRRCLDGESGAWDELVLLYSRYVYAIVSQGYRLTGPYAEDAFQDVFLRVYDRLDTLRDPSSLRPWIAQLTRTSDGATVLRFEHGTSPLTCAEFSSDGRAVVTAAEDGTVRVWPVDVVSVARAHAPSTPEMWPDEIPKESDEP